MKAGGWNGGGWGYQNGNYRGAGGGATDVRTNYIPTVDVTWSNNVLPAYWTQSATITSLNSRIIVAGGGGGSGSGLFGGTGGVGGGTSGGNGSGGFFGGTGGNQSGGGANGVGGVLAGFGYGGSAPNNTTVSGGGGGYYGGGNGNGSGGGSGYVGGMLPNTATGSLNFGWPTYNVQFGQTGYMANGVAPNGLCNIEIIG
jgi:hypothetical protein